MTGIRFFHGTLAVLEPGDVLVPGVEYGRHHYAWHRAAHVYATTTGFTATGMGWPAHLDTEDNRVATAIDGAEEWGCYAADMTCADPCHNSDCDPEFHIESHREGMVPRCVNVFEVEPLGEVEPDDSTDSDAPGVRMLRARVLQRVNPADKPIFDTDEDA